MSSSRGTVAKTEESETRSAARGSPDAETRAEAIAVRRQWMRMMGLDESEIDEHCGEDAVVVLEEEFAQLRAMERIGKLNEQQKHAS